MMYKVKISALGALRERIPSELEVDVAQHELSAFEFLEENFNIPRTESRLCFVINGRIQKGTYLLQPNDSIVILKMGGAG